MQVYELLHSSRNQCTELRSEVDQVRESLAAAESAAAHLRSQNVRLEKCSSQTEGELVTEVANLESKNRKLSEDVTRLTVRLEEIRGKEERFDEMEKRVVLCEDTNSRLQQQCSLSTLAEKRAREERDEAVTKTSQIEQTLEMLRLDKMYLQREVQTLRENLSKIEQADNRAHDKIRELKSQREELYERIDTMRSEWKKQYDDRLNDELKRLKDLSSNEIDQIRTHQSQAFERELRGVRESRDLALTERDRAQVKLEEVSR